MINSDWKIAWVNVLCIVCLFTLSCSGKGTPSQPDLTQMPDNFSGRNLSNGSSTQLWWVWDVSINTEENLVENIPDRGTLFTCNVTHFLESPQLKMEAGIVDLNIDEDSIDVVLDISLSNPFLTEQYRGFDVMGVFMGDGSDVFPGPDGFSIPGDGGQLLLNPDGYTRWFNFPEFAGAGSQWELFGYNAFDSGPSAYTPDAQLNPYKYFADGLASEENPFDFLMSNSGMRGSFGPDVKNTRRYEMTFPLDAGVTFKLAIVAHWKPNVNMPDPPENVQDFPLEANSDESPLVKITDDSTAYFIDDFDTGGNVRLNISVWDWAAIILTTTIDEYEIFCHSEIFDEPYAVDMTPTFIGNYYHTFKTAIPVNGLTSMDPIPVWVEVRYPAKDYSNPYGVNNDATGNLASYFYTEAAVHDFKPVWINVLQPNGGELLEVGKNYELKWETENLNGNIFILYSSDDFNFDIHPVAVNEVNDGSFMWQDIPDFVSKTVKMRVASMLNSSTYDDSDDNFEIFDSTEPFIRVVRPNGGELWKAGTARKIRWVSKNVQGNVYVEYSKDDFATDFHIIAIDVPNANESEFLWNDIPDDLSETVKVRISSMVEPGINDMSDDYFTIDDPPIEVLSPDGGEEWKAGSDHFIEWETLDFEGTLKIEYSKDHFVSDFHTIAENMVDTGSYEWVDIPNDPTMTARVRISSTADPSVRDISDDTFSIEESGWGLNFGGVENENIYDLDVDGSGNIYVCGIFLGSNVDFNPEPGVEDYHTSKGGSDIFLTKFNSLAEYEWTLTWGGSSFDRGYSLAADDDGNILVTGTFKGTNVDFDPDPSITQKDLHSAVGSHDVFVSKFDGTGDFVWAKTFGGPLEETGLGVNTDQFGNVYLTGQYRGDVDLDPGAGTDTKTGYGAGDIYLISLDSNGDYIWGNSWGGGSLEETNDVGYEVAVGDYGDLWVTGNVGGTDIDFDPDELDSFLLSAVDGSDAFISKFDLSGNFVFAGLWGGFLDDYGFGLDTDSDGNVYVTGRYEGIVDFDPGPGAEPYISNGEGYDAYLSKFNLIGTHLWTRVWGGTDVNTYGWHVSWGGNDRVHVIGDFEGLVDFDPTGGIDEHLSNGGFDIFLTSFNTGGGFFWTSTWGGPTTTDFGYGVYTDENGNAYIAGSITGDNVDFDPGEETDFRDTSNADAYIIKVLPDGEW